MCLALGHPRVAQGRPLGQIGVRIDAISQTDRDGDGYPDLTTIACTFATPTDRVLVFDGAGDMVWAEAWQSATDFDNDTWVFDVGATGSAQLIVRFAVEDDRSVAYFYDDQDGDGSVSYEIVNGVVKVTESPFPSVKALSDSAWYWGDGTINLGIVFDIDGIQTETFSPEFITPGSDGIIDVRIEEVVGIDNLPRYEVRRFVAPSPPSWGFVRTSLRVNSGRQVPNFPEDYAFFPFLVPHDTVYLGGIYFGSPPAVRMNWHTARIVDAGIYGYPTEAGWHLNSQLTTLDGQVNLADFENPMAYYDLAQDRDGSPEMHIRIQYYPPFASYYYDSLPEAIAEVRYSWNQSNADGLRWDYKVGLADTHEITTSVEFDGFSLKAVPVDELPWWVSRRAWGLATLVASESVDYTSSEGIYEWFPWYGRDPDALSHTTLNSTDDVREVMAAVEYLVGISAQSPAAHFTGIRRGMRGEYRFTRPGQPYLYFSPVDRKLHLMDAEYGVWAIDSGVSLDYQNLDGSHYIDQWRYLEAGEVRGQLNWVGDYLIYTAGDLFVLKRADAPPSLFETLPPRNHEEWLALGRQLEDQARDFAPGDFEAMLSQFPGAEWRVAGAHLRNLRPENGDFRFELVLDPGYRITGLDLMGVKEPAPGTYIVEYKEGGFAIDAAIPARLSLAVTQLSVSAPAQVTIHNTGTTDASRLTLVGEAVAEGGAPVELIRESVDALAGEVVQVLVTLPSTLTGATVRVWLEDAAGQVLAVQEQRLPAASGRTGGEGVFSLARTPVLWPVVGLFAALLAACAFPPTILGGERYEG